jgi:hypothetical protein
MAAALLLVACDAAERPDAGAERADAGTPVTSVHSGPSTLKASCNLDCAVVIDGQAYGAAPVTMPNIAPGKHKVRFTANSRFGTAVKEVEVDAQGGQPLEVNGRFGVGTLSVTASEPVTVIVGGKKLGRGTSQTLSLLEGKHEVTAVARTLGAKKQSVTIRDGEKSELSFDFAKP